MLQFLLVIIATASVSAQDFKTFRVGLAGGYASGTGEGGGSGAFGDVEPGYRLTDRILINFRYELAALIRNDLVINSTNIEIDASAIFSYTLNGQFYFSNKKFRPYVGFGFGLFRMGAIRSNSSTTDLIRSASKFGYYPRVGFDFGHFNMNVDVNIVPGTQGELANTEFSNSYIGTRLGFFLGGGRNK